jgi:hypothetical protein
VIGSGTVAYAYSYWTYNQLYNSQADCGPSVEIFELKSDGVTVIWDRTGVGEVDVTHAATYSRAYCWNQAAYSFLAHCTAVS